MDPEEEDFSDSDCSGNSTSSNESSVSDSSESVRVSNKNEFESTKITAEVINLPKLLCQDPTVFAEFFSLETWNGLSDPIRKHLSSFLPMFTDNIEFEKNSTIEALFTNKIKRFGKCPLQTLQKELAEGNCKPDISILNKSIAKAGRREQRFQEYERIGTMARKLAISRERLLRATFNNKYSSFAVQIPPSPRKNHISKTSFYTSTNMLRAKKRYYQEIRLAADQLSLPDAYSDEENHSDVAHNHFPRRQRRLYGSIQGGAVSPGADVRIVNTLGFKDSQITTGYLVGPNGKIFISERHYRDLLAGHKRRKIYEPDHAEMDCEDIKLKDVVFRTQASSGYRRIMPLPKVNLHDDINSNRAKNSAIKSTALDVESSSPFPLVSTSNKLAQLDEPMKESHDELNSDESAPRNRPSESPYPYGAETEQIIKRTRLTSDSEFNEEITEQPEQRSAIESARPEPMTHFDIPSNNDAMNSSDTAIDEVGSFKNIDEETTNAPLVNNSSDASTQQTLEVASGVIYTGDEETVPTTEIITTKHTSITKKSLDLTEGCIENATKVSVPNTVENNAYDKSMSELMQDTHKCFLSLLRDMFCSTPDHRLTIHELRIKLNMWLNTPIAALNGWYQNVDDKWDDMLQSAIFFLSGEFSDQPDDFVPYIEYKVQLNIYQWIGASRDSDHRLQDLCQYWLSRRHDMGVKTQNKPPKVASSKQKCTVPSTSSSSSSIQYVEENDESSERAISPPRFPTDWSVRKATKAEVNEFREQEKLRYENPHMAFTYKHLAYNSVVGPVKGIYTQVPGISKARGHNMLVADRPNFVTILTLVRDATARLPNGEGTRADICELLKSSQYISPTATDQVLQTIVSGALDRMHTEHDPCVKYDTKRKIWIYLHRNRTEEEFERLHHQYQGVAKHKKTLYRKSKSKEMVAVAPRKAASVPNIKSTSQSSLESESALSDTNVVEANKNVSKIVRIDSPSCLSTAPQPSPKMQTVDSSSLSTAVPQCADSQAKREAPYPAIGAQSERVANLTTKTVAKSQLSMISDSTDTGSQPNQQINISRPLASVAKKIISTVPSKSIVINTSASLAAVNSTSISGNTIPLQISTDTTEHVGKSFIMPVALNSEAVTRVNLATTPITNIPTTSLKGTSILQPKTTASTLSTTMTLMQANKQQLESNKQPAKVIPVNVCSGNSMTTNSSAVILRTDTLGSPAGENSVNLPKSQQTVLTPVQQKQILQNLLAQQHRQVITSKSIVLAQTQPTSVAMVSPANIVAAGSQSVASIKTMKHMQKIPALTLSPGVAQPAVLQAISSGMANPHVIQIKSSNNIIGASSGAKIQPLIAAKYAQQRQQPMIAKSINVMSGEPAEIRAKSAESLPKPAAGFVQSSASDTTITRVLKAPASSQPGTTSIVRTSLASNTISVNQGGQQVVAKVVKSIGEGQILSLDNLLARQRIPSDMTLRLAEPKHLKTQLIQLSSDSSGLPIAQYAMVSQNRSVIPTSGQCTITTSKPSTATEPKVAQLISSINSTIVGTGRNLSTVHKSVPVSGLNILHKASVASSPQQVNQLTVKQTGATQQICTKIAGTNKILPAKARAGANFITSSPINIATLGSNPLIIASKPAATVRSEIARQSNPNVIVHNTADSPNIVYGRPATVNVQGNLLSQGHVNLISTQQGNNSAPTQKLVLSNQLVKVRAMPRQQHVQFSFTQQPSVNPVINTVASAGSSGTTIGVLKANVLEQQNKTPLSTAVPKTATTVATPAKMPQKVGIRLNPHPQRMVLAGGQLVTTQQILVQSGVQGGPFNIKRLKVIPVNNNPKEQAMRPNITGIQCKVASSVPGRAPTNKEAVGEGSSKLFHVYSNATNTSTGDNLESKTESNN